MEVKGVNENSLEVTLTQYKQFKFKFKMIWTFKFCFKCKLKYKFLLKFSFKNCTTDVSSCFLCDICGRWFRTTKDLEKYKKIKCDLRSQCQLASGFSALGKKPKGFLKIINRSGLLTSSNFLLKFSIKNCTADVSSCFLFDIFCGRWFRTTKDLEKYKKIKCDLKSQCQLASRFSIKKKKKKTQGFS